MVNGSRRKNNSYGVGRIIINEESGQFGCMSKEIFYVMIYQFSRAKIWIQLSIGRSCHEVHSPNEKVLPFKITDQPSLFIYLRGAEKPTILRVYVEENPIEEDIM